LAQPPGSLAEYDWAFSRQGARRLAGVDEAGRGCWAGPVVAAAVILPPRWIPEGLDDSKRLSARRREKLYAEIRAGALAWGACAVSAAEIDRLNILRATLLAMARSVAKLDPPPDIVLVDGLQAPAIAGETHTVVRGDSRSAAIAAASIIAKVARDRVMIAWDRRFPGFGFASHKGYGAAIHKAALQSLGPCPLHRASYRPIAALRQGAFWNESR